MGGESGKETSAAAVAATTQFPMPVRGLEQLRIGRSRF